MLRNTCLSLFAVLVLSATPLAGAADAGPWTDLGGGIAGVTGIPVLAGQGALSAGTPGDITLSSAAPSAPCLLFFSFLEVGVPFKGGTLSAYPPLATFLFSTNPAGSVTLPWSTWPAGLPAGLELFFQTAVADTTAVQNVALSNLLRGVIQP